MFHFSSLFSRSIVFRASQVRRSLYGVKHNAKRGIFYIRLGGDDSAILTYKANGNILDMQAINVPSHHQGQGLARLLTEAALTYVIVNDYYMLLNCEYMQKFYLATKTPELEERVVGPKHLLEAGESSSLRTETVYELPEPEDFTVPFEK